MSRCEASAILKAHNDWLTGKRPVSVIPSAAGNLNPGHIQHRPQKLSSTASCCKNSSSFSFAFADCVCRSSICFAKLLKRKSGDVKCEYENESNGQPAHAHSLYV